MSAPVSIIFVRLHASTRINANFKCSVFTRSRIDRFELVVTVLCCACVSEQVSKLAGVLARRCGVRVGDRVLIYMPQVPQAIGAMLACARIGAIHSVVYGGFAAKELATRIQHARVCSLQTKSMNVNLNTWTN